MIQVRNIHKTYVTGDVSNEVLKGISFDISSGEFVAIMGKSGSGKSTLLNILGGIDRPTVGKVLIHQQDIFALDDEALTQFRRQHIGFIFQQFNLLPVLNVYENMIFSLSVNDLPIDKNEVHALATLLGIQDKLTASVSSLSGGEQQRVAIARALLLKPQIILADEPTGNLDSTNGKQVLEIFQKLNSELNQTIVMITHDAEFARAAKRLIRIEDGRIYE